MVIFQSFLVHFRSIDIYRFSIVCLYSLINNDCQIETMSLTDLLFSSLNTVFLSVVIIVSSDYDSIQNINSKLLSDHMITFYSNTLITIYRTLDCQMSPFFDFTKQYQKRKKNLFVNVNCRIFVNNSTRHASQRCTLWRVFAFLKLNLFNLSYGI